MDTTMTRGAADAAQGAVDSATRQPWPARPSGSRPPGPRGRWLGLSLLADMKHDYLGFAEARHRQYGDVCNMRVFQERAYDLFSPDMVREALVDHADALVRWERGVEVFAQTFGRSVLTTEGPTWERQRRMLMPAFTPKRVAGYAGLMREAAATALEQALPAGAARGEVGMDELFSRVAMDVILRTLFGQALHGEAEAAIDATRVMSEIAMHEMFFPVTMPDWLPLPGKAAKRRALRTLRGLVDGHIRRRREQADPQAGEDLLARLLALRDEATGQGLSEQELFDQCIVSFQAGHETTATALLWWSRLLAAHPQAAARAREEVDAVLAGRDPDAQDAAALPYLTATLKEAMRLYPPIAALMTRRTTREITVGGWHIPPGTLLYVTPWVLQRDRRWWPQPNEFRPERFLPGAPEVPRGAYIPFGVGPRVCLGQHFAMLEMTIVAAMLLRRYELTLPPGTPEPEAVLNVTLRPKGGVRLLLRRRS